MLFRSNVFLQEPVEVGPQLLPRRWFVLHQAIEKISYGPGFLVPVGCGELDVIVAARPAASGGFGLAAIHDIDSHLRPVDAGHRAEEVERLRAWLTHEGFTLRELRVREP